MAAFDEHGGVKLTAQIARAGGHVLACAHGAAPEHFGLVHIRCDDGGQRQQFLAERAHGIVFEQTPAAGGHHDRIDDKWHALADFAPRSSHRADLLRTAEHARFRCSHGKGREEHAELIRDEFRVQQADLRNEPRRLRDHAR